MLLTDLIPIGIISFVAASILMLVFNRETFRTDRWRAFRLLFVRFFGLWWAIASIALLFKTRIFSMNEKGNPFEAVNLVPFGTIAEYLAERNWAQIFGNMLVFFLFPVLLHLNFPNLKNKTLVSISMSVVLLIEPAQALINIIGGAPVNVIDIDDLLLNVSGCLLGLLALFLFRLIIRRKRGVSRSEAEYVEKNDCAKAIDYLKKDPVHHMDMLQPIYRGTAEILSADSTGVLLQEKVSQAYLLTAQTQRDAERLMGNISEPRLMAVHHDFVVDEVKQRFGLEATMCCYQAVWLHAAPPTIRPSQFLIMGLSQDMASDIAALYSHDIGLEYVKGRLLAGEMFGAFIGDELAGFIGLHEEGSMGMLEVVPRFRRMGVGSLLVAYLSGRLLEKGLTPYSQFTIDNESSRRLHERLGFSISTDRIYWLELKK